MSTPNGKQGFFAGTWFSGDDTRHCASATIETSACIPKTVIEDQRRSLTRNSSAATALDASRAPIVLHDHMVIALALSA